MNAMTTIEEEEAGAQPPEPQEAARPAKKKRRGGRYALMLAETIGLSKDFQPQTAAYWQRLRGRDGYRRALAAQEKAAAEQGVKPGF